jgi:hypothetical protein
MGVTLKAAVHAPPPKNPHNLISGDALTNNILSFCRIHIPHRDAAYHHPTDAKCNLTQLTDASSITDHCFIFQSILC